MQNVSIKFNGALVLWSITGTAEGETVNTKLRELGLPEAPTIDTQEALRLAMHKDSNRRVMVRPLSQGVGYALVEEKDTGTEMEYQEVYRAIVVDGSLVGMPGRKIVSCSVGADSGLSNNKLYQMLQARFDSLYGRIDATRLGSCLTNAVRSMGGVAVRNRGGVYWLPEERLEGFSEVAQVVEEGARGSSVFRVRTVADEQTVKLITASLDHEVGTEAARIQEELMGGELGERAIETRQRRLGELQSRVEEYEGMLGERMSSLKSRLEEVGMAQVVAELTTGTDTESFTPNIR